MSHYGTVLHSINISRTILAVISGMRVFVSCYSSLIFFYFIPSVQSGAKKQHNTRFGINQKCFALDINSFGKSFPLCQDNVSAHTSTFSQVWDKNKFWELLALSGHSFSRSPPIGLVGFGGLRVKGLLKTLGIGICARTTSKKGKKMDTKHLSAAVGDFTRRFRVCCAADGAYFEMQCCPKLNMSQCP